MLITTSNTDISTSLDNIINKEENIIGVIQAYLIKAITSNEEDKTITGYIEKALEISKKHNLIMPIVEMSIPLNRFFQDQYIKTHKDELKKIRRLSKSYANGIKKIYTNSNYSDLTLKEFTALFFVAQGKRNKEIAKIMKISENTLKYYLKLAFEKENISKRKEATKIIVKPTENIKMGGENI